MKKIYILLFASLAMTLSVVAADFTKDGLYYNIRSKTDLTCEVTNSGGYWGDYSGDIVIPSTVDYDGATYTVVAIGGSAFYWCGGLSSVTIPATVTSIGGSAFNLTSSYVLYDYASTPQSLGGSVFFSVGYPTVHVYKGLKDVYANAGEWSKCTIVDDLEPTLVTELSIVEADDVVCEPYEGKKLSCSILPEDASIKELKWESSDESVLHVEGDGTLVGVTEGDAVVMASAKDGSGITASCNVRVNAVTSSSDYKPYLTSQTTTISTTSMAGIYRKGVGFVFANNGPHYIYVTKLIVKNPSDNYAVLSQTTDLSLLGWLAPGRQLALSVTFSTDITPCYEWHYLYKGVEYIFCSDANDPVPVEEIAEEVATEVVARYTLDGRRILSPVRGVNIVRMNDGSVKRVMVK